MSSFKDYIAVGFSLKDGDADFRISGEIYDLDFEKMQKLRAMIPVAIAQAEQMWMRAWMERPENQACAAEPKP